MNNLPQMFSFEGNEVRTVTKGNEPWFVLKDVCEVLEIAHRVVRQRLDDDVCSTYPIPDSLGRLQDTTIINEDGLYDVILESRKPEAKAFRKWVTSEVIPSIRNHGVYMTSEAIEKVMYNPDFIINLASKWKEEREARLEAETRIEQDKPKVIFAEALETSSNSILIGELAKLLKQNGIDIGQNRLFRVLREQGFLGTKGDYYNIPTQRAMEMRLFELKTTTITSPEGETKVRRTPKVTGRGQLYFINKFKVSEVS